MAARIPLFFSTDYSPEEMASGDSLGPIGKIVLVGIAGVSVEGGGGAATGFADPSNPQDLATKAYVDAFASGLDVHTAVMAKTTVDLSTFVAAGTGVGKTLTAPDFLVSWNTIDDRLLVLTDRVLVSMQGGDDITADVDNGIYEVTQLGDGSTTKFTLTRATTEDTGTELHQGVYVFVSWGTAYSNTGWTMVTPNPITIDTTPIKFSQFNAETQLTFEQGLVKTLSAIKVDLDTAANAAGAGAGGGSSGLEFDANTAAGKLRVAVLPAGGITRQATGIGVHLDGTTLALDVGGAGTGLSVKGVPTIWEIGGSTVTGVSAADLVDLTDGGETSLHTHASVPATDTPLVQTDWVAGTAGVTQYYPVYVDTTNNCVLNGDTDTDAKCAVIGISTVTAASTNPVPVDSAGIKAGALTGLGFTAGQRIYLKTGGGLHNAAPGASKRVVEMGFAKNATDLFLRIIDRGKKAA